MEEPEISTRFSFDTSTLEYVLPIELNIERTDIFIPDAQIYRLTWSINKREIFIEPYKRFAKAFNTRFMHSSFIENLRIQDIHIKLAHLGLVIDKHYIHYTLEIAPEDISFIERIEIKNENERIPKTSE